MQLCAAMFNKSCGSTTQRCSSASRGVSRSNLGLTKRHGSDTNHGGDVHLGQRGCLSQDTEANKEAVHPEQQEAEIVKQDELCSGDAAKMTITTYSAISSAEPIVVSEHGSPYRIISMYTSERVNLSQRSRW